MMKMTTRKDTLRHLEVSNNYYESSGCDICAPIPIRDLEEFIAAWDESAHEPLPWLCSDCARALDLVW